MLKLFLLIYIIIFQANLDIRVINFRHILFEMAIVVAIFLIYGTTYPNVILKFYYFVYLI